LVPDPKAGIFEYRNTNSGGHTDKKENQIFLIYKEIQSGAVAKSCMRKGKYFTIYEEAVRRI
jgi:hypothetical protein